MRVGHVGSTADDPALVSNITLPRLQEEVESFEQIAAYVQRTLVWLGPDGPRSLPGAMVSPSLFRLLRAAPHRGRLFVEEDAAGGADRVALLSHGAWTNRYASDPDIVGASLDVDGEAFTAVGVLSEGFSFPTPEAEIWMPLAVPPFEPGVIGLRFPALGRLRPGATPEQAAAEVQTVLNADRSPSDPRPLLEAHVMPLQEEMVRGYRPALMLLSAVTALVLAIACINVAGLSCARGRAETGAGRPRCAGRGAGADRAAASDGERCAGYRRRRARPRGRDTDPARRAGVGAGRRAPAGRGGRRRRRARVRCRAVGRCRAGVRRRSGALVVATALRADPRRRMRPGGRRLPKAVREPDPGLAGGVASGAGPGADRRGGPAAARLRAARVRRSGL